MVGVFGDAIRKKDGRILPGKSLKEIFDCFGTEHTTHTERANDGDRRELMDHCSFHVKHHRSHHDINATKAYEG